MSADARATFTRLLNVLVQEEEHLVTLIELAGQERAALVSSDFDAIESISADMVRVAGDLDAFEEQRALLLQELDAGPDTTLSELEPLAAAAGADGLAEARARMLARAAELEQVQEQNARLILAATRLRERWFSLLTGMSAATYTDSGKEQRSGQQIVSKSA